MRHNEMWYNKNMDKQAWMVAVSMGYGHQRTAHPLRHLAFGGKVINANDYKGIPQKDRNIWENSRKFYEFISRLKRLPLIGEAVFAAFDKFQEILSYYPKRDLSKPNIQLRQIYSLIKKGWGKHLIEELKLKNAYLPLVTTFFIPAFMAEYFDYLGEIYCIVCDADISRTWVSLDSAKSRIKYCAPTARVAERLRLYGVKPENIFFTGFPLPLGNIGGESMAILKEDLKSRLLNLDPEGRYREKYKILVENTLGQLPEESSHPLTLMFAVGGAGAQKEMGGQIVKSLAVKIWANDIKVILVAGIREKVKEYFEKNLEKLKLKNHPNVEIIFGKDIESYFQQFNQALRQTDILWTKPSELSFYSALGLPIIIAPTIGSQEEFNMRWLLKSGFGIAQENLRYTSQWLFDWLKQGYLAESAMEGFVEGEKLGTLNIETCLLAGRR